MNLKKQLYNRERERNREKGVTHKITIETRVPSKWRFVDLETGDVWLWNGKAFKSADRGDIVNRFQETS